MKTSERLAYGLGFVTLLATTTAFAAAGSRDRVAVDDPAGEAETSAGAWRLEATRVRVVGGYGHNFAYNGENVRWLDGKAEIELDASSGTARIVVEVETTDASGPIRYSKDQSWSGKIRIVQLLNTSQMEGARIAEDLMLHGDTGNWSI